jgi:hypothetical protein
MIRPLPPPSAAALLKSEHSTYILKRRVSFEEFCHTSENGSKLSMSINGHIKPTLYLYYNALESEKKEPVVQIFFFDIVSSPSSKCNTLLVPTVMQKEVEDRKPDYYMKVNEAWCPNYNDKQFLKVLEEEFETVGQRLGDITNLPSEYRMEVLSMIARTKDNSNPKMGKMYEVIREERNNEDSKVLELRELKDVQVGSDLPTIASDILRKFSWE